MEAKVAMLEPGLVPNLLLTLKLKFQFHILLLDFLSKYPLAISLAGSYTNSRKDFLVVPSSCVRTEESREKEEFEEFFTS